MKKTSCSMVDVEIPLSGFDFGLMGSKVEYYNGSEQYLMFDFSPSPGILRFIHILKYDPNRKDPAEELAEIADLFECPCTARPITTAEMTPEIQKSLSIARQLMFSNRFFGESRSLWNTADRRTIVSDIDQWIGYGAFKIFVSELIQYCDNTKGFRSRANYNVILINDHGFEEDQFIEAIFKLYASEGILRDSSIIVGDLSDAVSTQKNTPCLYHITERWEVEASKGSYLTTKVDDSSFRELSKRQTIYVTAMTRDQLTRAQKNDSFRSLFPRWVEIHDFTGDEKILTLKRQAQECGFVLLGDTLSNEVLAQKTMPLLCFELSGIINRRLGIAGSTDRTIRFDELGVLIETEPTENALNELEGMVGLKGVKSQLAEITNYLRLRGKESFPCLHMVFKGNPGTGKTTVARLLGQIFSETGILPGGNVFVETDREGLVGMFVGHTAVQTAEKVREALGGVLFIDEAYSLGIYDKGHDFGDEAISTLVKQMEDHRRDFVCILAGYPEEMDQMIDRNPGLRDRIQFYIDFPDYSQSELLEIFLGYCAKEAYVMEQAARATLLEYFHRIVQTKTENFANARLVRKIFERMRMKQAMRTTENSVTAADIEAIFREKDLAELLQGSQIRKQIGFKI